MELASFDMQLLWVPSMCTGHVIQSSDTNTCGELQSRPKVSRIVTRKLGKYHLHTGKSMLLDWYWISSSARIDTLAQLGNGSEGGRSMIRAGSSHSGWPMWANQNGLTHRMGFGPHIWNLDFTLARHVDCRLARSGVGEGSHRTPTRCTSDPCELCAALGSDGKPVRVCVANNSLLLPGHAVSNWAHCTRSPANFGTIREPRALAAERKAQMKAARDGARVSMS